MTSEPIPRLAHLLELRECVRRPAEVPPKRRRGRVAPAAAQPAAAVVVADDHGYIGEEFDRLCAEVRQGCERVRPLAAYLHREVGGRWGVVVRRW